MSVSVSTVVMAHPRRDAMVEELLGWLDRPAEVVWDAGDNNRWNTGRRAWLAIDRTASHGLVIQDDAIPCRDLVAGVERALPHVPDDSPLCLYCGRARPYRELVQRLTSLAGDASWLTMAQCHWGPGIVLPTKWIDDMVTWCDQRTDVANYDRRISRWIQHRGLTVWYPWPSLVDHRISPSLVPGRTAAGRHAHRFLGADRSALDRDWAGRVVAIPALNAREAEPRKRPGGTPMLFVSLKYPNLDLSNKPSLHGIRFRDGMCEVDRPAAISILQSPWWQRRGVRLATDEDLKLLATSAKAPVVVAARGEPAAPPAAETAQPVDNGAPAAADAAPPNTETQVTVVPDEVRDGTAADVRTWVGDDPNRAQLAIAAEQARDKPRTSLLTRLTKIAG